MLEIDSTLSGFIRGQALVCLALSVIYTTGLSIVGLHYGAAIGIISGVLSFIPYVGTFFGWTSSLLLGSVQFSDWPHFAGIIGVFLFGHIMEAYILTPRLVGHRVGLHPVWILFAIIAGAKLLGFTGVIIAVPTAAVIGVLTRFALRQYKDSTIYKDPPRADAAMTRQLPLSLPHDEAMDAADFFVTASNREAMAWIDKWPDWPAHCIVIHGPSGSGKTHLARLWQQRSGARLLQRLILRRSRENGNPS